jgi:CRP-like cAMP-binding protein
MVQFFNGDIIFHEGDHADIAYVIESGRVEITRKNEGIVATLGIGQMFGEMGPLDGNPRNATARALGEVMLREIIIND